MKIGDEGMLYVFYHHIYEFQKGLRNLVLCTEKSEDREKIEARLKKDNISYLIHDITSEKINVYFGNEACIKVVESFNNHRLNELSDEQDFMLGVMLGYDRLQQCYRYLIRIGQRQKIEELIG